MAVLKLYCLVLVAAAALDGAYTCLAGEDLGVTIARGFGLNL
jgi:hypothetical protein